MVHPLLACRWSPTTFDESYDAGDDEVEDLAHLRVEDTDWEYSEFSHYDLGQAVAHMTIQAQALGLHVRQFRAFDRLGVDTEFEVPDHWEVTTMMAVGRAGQSIGPAPGATERFPPPRHRKTRDEILWAIA